MRRPMRRRHVLALAATLAAGTGGLVAACATNPVTGKSQISLVSEQQEIQMGQEAAQQVKATMGFVQDPALQDYVSRIGMTMAKASERPNLPWEFHVVDDPSPNAFALPGGFIYVTRGLLTDITNEAQLATVVGHEIGHVTNRHSVNQISKQQLATLGLGIGSILSPTVARFGQLASAGLQLLFLKYSRDDETEADKAGFRYALKDGYDVRQMPAVFEMLKEVSQLQGGGGVPSWLQTHPTEEARIQDIRQKLDTLHANLANAKVGRDAYLQRIQGLVFGDDPRQGYFENGVFYHPELRFQLAFPQGWQTQNTPQAVAAISPNQDAILQMTLAQGGAQQAAQQFFAQQGIQSQNVQTTSVNGLPAVSGYFQAQTDQGAVAGLVTFLTYGQATYQILGYTAAANLSAYDATFRQVTGSFRQLTDPSKINVQPKKIELVKLPRAMTIEEFNQQYPSSIPVEMLAIINEVQPGVRMDAGVTVKRVR
ncbi:MAG TPA: M48 family metalloprotease [Gemmatimonadales bacterium]|nr:M48 family metalloprotease [Gemmatimonadales bacterium]